MKWTFCGEPAVVVLPPAAVVLPPACAVPAAGFSARLKSSTGTGVHVGSPDCAGTLTAFHAALTALYCLHVGSRFLAAVNVAMRYLKCVIPDVLSSMAL